MGGDFASGMARVRLNERFFFINHQGARITPQFDGLFDFQDDLAAAIVDGKLGYIRRDGTFALAPLYNGTSGSDFSENLAAARIGSAVGFIDKTGAIVVKPSY